MGDLNKKMNQNEPAASTQKITLKTVSVDCLKLLTAKEMARLSVTEIALATGKSRAYVSELMSGKRRRTTQAFLEVYAELVNKRLSRRYSGHSFDPKKARLLYLGGESRWSIKKGRKKKD